MVETKNKTKRKKKRKTHITAAKVAATKELFKGRTN
jgi:hypothetical protein